MLEIVGADKYRRQLNPVDGEDYSNLSMSDDKFTVTTADGVSLSYEQKVNSTLPYAHVFRGQNRSVLYVPRPIAG